MIHVKRAYEPAARGDGRRFLVERLWPRGLTKDAVAVEAWLKDVAPSAALRTWYAHDVARWDEFRRRYTAELDANPDGWRPLAEAAAAGPITLVYAARDEAHNSAVVLRDYLARVTGSGRTASRRGGPRRSGSRAGATRRVRAR